MREKQDNFTIMNGRVKMTGKGGYKTTADAVWLADAVQAKKNAAVLDVGIGAGGAALSLMERIPSLAVMGVDTSETNLGAAWVNALLNGRGIELELADIMTWKTSRLFDVVMTNPPYFKGTPRKDGAHHNADIFGWVKACVKRLRARGYFYIIIAPGVMDQTIAALVDSKCGAIAVQPIKTRDADDMERVIISARLGVKSPAQLFQPMLK